MEQFCVGALPRPKLIASAFGPEALSAQLATMQLNMRHNYVNGSALVYAPGLLLYGTAGLNSAGFISINDLMAAGAAEIQAHALTTSGSPYRAGQEALKDALEDANNNRASRSLRLARSPLVTKKRQRRFEAR